VKEGKFRGDLLARLNEHVVRLPPLRERKEDIFLLANSFCARYGRPGMQFSFSFLVALFHYDWPFNVRELESCIKRGVALTDGEELDTMHLPDAISEHMKGYGDRQRVSLPSNLPAAPYEGAAPFSGSAPGGSPTAPPPPVRRGPPTEEELRALLDRHKGNVAAVGRELGKERMQVHRWLKRYNIDLSQYRDE
jgi:sigma-54 dependent transcriptional regulator, acetoin dehydrogenase operon transcriptional activator AcoR